MPAYILCPHCRAKVEFGLPECPHCRNSFHNSNPRGALGYATPLAEHYTVGKFLSADGEGCIYEGVENETARQVNIKEYFPAALSLGRGPEGAIRPKEQKEVLYKNLRMDFAELYRNLQKVSARDGLQTVLAVLEKNNTVYAVLDRAEGMPLNRYLAGQGGRVAAMEAVRVMSALMEGVAAMNRQCLLHRGICPGNIQLDENGLACLSGYATSSLRSGNGVIQSQLYDGFSAPEQYDSASFEGQYTDVYALAAVLYRMVTGRTPRSASERRENDSMVLASKLNPEVPEYFALVLERAMSLVPEERFPTVQSFVEALTSKEKAAQVLEPVRPKSPSLPRSVIAGIAIGVVVVGLLVAFFLLLPREQAPQPPASSEPSSSVVTTNRAPDLRNMQLSQVESYYAATYQIESSEHAYSDTVPKGAIISQNPAPGVEIEKGATIRVVVSDGPAPILMPNLKGWTRASAEEKLLALGLVPNFKTMENNDPSVAGMVLSTDVEPGAEMQVGDMVIVYIGGEVPVSSEPDSSGSDEPDEPSTSSSEEEDYDNLKLYDD